MNCHDVEVTCYYDRVHIVLFLPLTDQSQDNKILTHTNHTYNVYICGESDY